MTKYFFNIQIFTKTDFEGPQRQSKRDLSQRRPLRQRLIKVNSRFIRLCRVYSNSPKLVKYRWLFLKLNSLCPVPQLQKEKENWIIIWTEFGTELLFIICLCTSCKKTSHKEISRRGRAGTARKHTKGVLHMQNCRLLITPIAFLKFSSPSPSSSLKLPKYNPLS